MGENCNEVEGWFGAFGLDSDEEELVAHGGKDGADSSAPADVGFAYKSKKPRWWKQLSRRATKAQKQAMVNMEAIHLRKPRYSEEKEFIDWSTVFGQEHCEVWLEIGFGTGDNLLSLSHRYRNDAAKCFVGAEVHGAGSGRLFQIAQEGVVRKNYWRGYSLFNPREDQEPNVLGVDDICEEESVSNDHWDHIPCTDVYRNLRIHCGDGVKLLSHIPSQSVSCLLITFPDPFPQDCQIEWRIFQLHTVRDFWRALSPGGHLYLATDHPVCFSWSKSVVDQVNEEEGRCILQALDPCPDRSSWLPVVSKYEKKGWDEGRKTMLQCWEAQS